MGESSMKVRTTSESRPSADHRPQARSRRTMPALCIALVGAVLLVLPGCGPSLGKPALRQPAASPRVFDASDPSVLVAGGKYYLFGSSNNMKLPVRQITTFNGTLADSQSFWAQHSADAMPTRPAWIDSSEWQIWAPSAVQISTKYYVYFAGHRAGAVDEVNDQCIGRAVATVPTGPYTPERSPIYCGLKKVDAAANPWGHGALDPEVIKAADGKKYLIMALSRTKGNIGSVRLDSTGVPVGGSNASPTILASQSFPWHDGVDDGTLRSSDAFLENPAMIYEPKTKTYLLFYSAGQWYSNRYLTGFGRCSSPAGPCVLDSRGPWLKSSSTRSGVGALTAFRGNDGTLRVAYASWQAGHESPTSNPDGIYSRQVSWGVIKTSSGTDPSTQTVSLG
jgi:hypothetical protein